MKNTKEVLESKESIEIELKELEQRKYDILAKKQRLDHIYTYSIKDISIIFPKLIELIDQKEFSWHEERVTLVNPAAGRYMEQVEVGYLLEKSLDTDDLFDMNGKIKNLKSLEELGQNKEQFIPVCERISEGYKYYYDSSKNGYWYGQAEPMLFLDFEKNGKVDEKHQELGRIVVSDLDNEYYPYLLSFIDYATTWRLENDRSCKLHEGFYPTEITKLAVPFVEEYQKTYQKRK